jgi:glycosyltransferase involved in cell wall biosynthesis
MRHTVCLVCTNADRAGAPLHVMQLAKSLAHQFRVVCVFGESGPVSEELVNAGIVVHIANRMRSNISPLSDILCIFKLARILLQERVTLVHAHSSKAGLLARIAARFTGAKFCFTVHGWGFGPKRPRLQAALVWLSELFTTWLVDHYIAVSRFDEMLGRKRLAIPSRRLTMIYNGVPDSRHRAFPSKSNVLVMVARVHTQKDHDTFARAIGRLRGSFEVWFVGDGTDSSEFIERMSFLAGDSRDRLRFFGVTSAVGDLLVNASVFCLASRFEGLPLSIIEAMSIGLPIVATDVGGVAEIVADEANGFVVPVEDVLRFAQAIQSLLDSPRLRDSMGSVSRNIFEQGFEERKMVEAVIGVYGKLMA